MVVSGCLYLNGDAALTVIVNSPYDCSMLYEPPVQSESNCYDGQWKRVTLGGNGRNCPQGCKKKRDGEEVEANCIATIWYHRIRVGGSG